MIGPSFCSVPGTMTAPQMEGQHVFLDPLQRSFTFTVAGGVFFGIRLMLDAQQHKKLVRLPSRRTGCEFQDFEDWIIKIQRLNLGWD